MAELPELLCRVNFPLYHVSMITPRHILLAGGGGAAKTGVHNGFEIFEIRHNGQHCVAESVKRFSTGEFAVMNCSAGSHKNQSTTIAVGHNERTQLYKCQLVREIVPDQHAGANNGEVVNRKAKAKKESDSRLTFEIISSKSVQTDFLSSFLFGMCEDVRLEVSRLCKFLVASIKRAHIWSVPRVDSNMGAKVEVQREAFPAALKSTLERFFPSVNQLMPFKLGALNKGFATLGTDVNPRSVGMQMFSHGRIIAKHFSAPFVRTGNGSGNFFTTISLRLDPCKLGELLWIGEIKSRNTSGWQLLPSHVLGVVGVRLVRRDHVIKAGHIGFLVVI